MAKSSGLGHQLLVGTVNLAGDIRSVDSIATPRGTYDCTGIDKSAMERLHGRRDGRLACTASFNDAANQAHPTLSALPTTDVQFSYLCGTTAGDRAASITAKQLTYNANRSQDGDITFTVDAVANGYALGWGHLLTDSLETITGASNLAGAETAAAATDLGLAAYLHVSAFTGTSAAITIEDSDDNGSVDPYALVTGAAFSSVTGTGVERINTAATENVKQWLRVAVTGTFTSLTFAVIAVRNATS